MQVGLTVARADRTALDLYAKLNDAAPGDALLFDAASLAKQPPLIHEAQGTSSTSAQPVRTGQALPKRL